MSASFDKKVMIISNSVSGGGAEISMMRLFDVLRELHPFIEVCAINEDGITNVLIDRVTIIGRKWGSGLKGTIKCFRDFRSHLLLSKPDILIVNCELPELYVAFSAPTGTRIIAVEHTSRPWEGRKILGILVRLILKARSTKWVTVSREESLIWPYSIKPKFIPNSHIESEKTVVNKPSDLVFVGRMNKGKHPEIAAEAATLTKSTLNLFGDGPELTRLKERYQNSDLKFYGYVEDPWSHISSNSILIVASEHEGDGMSIVEAVANDNPILLTNNADLKRFNFPEKNYFEAIEDLTQKIYEAKKNGLGYFRIPQSTRTRLLTERDPIRVAQEWIKLLAGESKS